MTKSAKPLAWSYKATAEAAWAIDQLRRVRAKQADLAKKAALLQETIIKERGGMAHGVRAAIRHQSASSKMRLVRTKARDYVVLLDAQGRVERARKP